MINIENITYSYIKSKKIFDGFSFTVKDGESWGIIGFNGAGKSTLIKMILGIIKIKSGNIDVEQKNIYKNRKKIMLDIGVVWGQKPTLWWDIPVYDSYRMLKKIYRISDKDFDERIRYLDSSFFVSEYWEQPLRTLSLGQRVKAEIVASLLHKPKILIYDEPFIGLDFFNRKKIIDLLKKYRSDNKCTLLLTSHNILDINDLCENILLLDKGKSIYRGSVDEIKREYHSIRKINVYYQNEYFFIPDNISDKLMVTDKSSGQKQIIFDTSVINYQNVIQEIIIHNDIIEIENDDNLLEQLIENILGKAEDDNNE